MENASHESKIENASHESKMENASHESKMENASHESKMEDASHESKMENASHESKMEKVLVPKEVSTSLAGAAVNIGSGTIRVNPSTIKSVVTMLLVAKEVETSPRPFGGTLAGVLVREPSLHARCLVSFFKTLRAVPSARLSVLYDLHH
eukprot:1160255-Pelagomonas_calceolata.AAC.8